MTSPTTRVLAFACGLALAGTATGQTAFYRDVTATQLPRGLAGPCMDAAAGDADGDGDLDLALAMEFEPNILLLNDGSGVFTIGADRLPSTIHDSEDVAFADFDGDGDLDLVLVSEDDRTDELYINDGTGRYSDASERFAVAEVSNALAVLDVNGDGAPDLLKGNIGTDRLLVNDGQGHFRDETAERWPQGGESRTQDLELADVDGDGDLDVIVGNEGQNELFLNDHGRFTNATARHLPTRIDETREIRAVDVDGDGDLDLLVANVRFGMEESARDYLLLNDGTGVFAAADSSAYPEDGRSNFTVQALDLDGDGDMDVLAPSTIFPRSETEFLLLVTDAEGRASVVRAPGFDTRDVDGDGDLDAILIDGDRSQTFSNEGGRLVAAAGAGQWEPATAPQEIDVDDDGDPDIALARIELDAGARNGSDGGDAGDVGDASDAGDANDAGDTGNAGDVGPPAGAAAPLARRIRTSVVQLADLDLDGDFDVVIPSTVALDAAGDYLALINDGSGRFSAASPGTVLPAEAVGNGFDVEVADFDADGIEDLFLCNRASIAEPESAAGSGGLQRLLLGRRVR